MRDGDRAKVVRVIRINRIGAAVMFGLVAITAALILLDVLSFDAQSGLNLVFGIALGSLGLLTARSAQKDLDDPAGIETRFQREAVTMSAVLLLGGFALVAGIIVWGLLS